jgi:acyl-CoA dehydrogenase family protein 9
LVEGRGAGECERELALCDLFCVEAGRRFRSARVKLESPEDETRREVAGMVREAGGYFVEDSILAE